MSPAAPHLLAWLQLTRLPLVFTAISNLWLVVFWNARIERDLAVEQPALGARLALAALIGGGMYVFGMTLNDVMDIRRDRALAPRRPLPAGRLRPRTALVTALIGLLIAVAAAVPLGTVPTLFCVGCAALIVLYDGGLKYVPGVGLLLLGLIRGANMLIADPGMAYLWPVWLTLSHVVGISAVAYALERKRPLLTAGHALLLIVGYAFWSLAMIGWMVQRADVPAVGLAWVGPAAAAGAFLLIARIQVAGSENRKAAGAAIMRIGLIWLIVYDLTWLAAVGYWSAAAAHLVLLVMTVVSVQLVRHAARTDTRPPDRTGYRLD